jgi:GT2 family glycosyltransferase
LKQVSIIIPFRDKIGLLRQCVFSILEKTDCQKYEIILANNQSRGSKTEIFLDELKKNNKISVLNYDNPFNFSAINNLAVKHAKGEFILFLNNDTEVISPNWLDEMLACFEDEKVGVVGAKLLYPNNTIQHCGVMLEEKRLAIHAFRTWKESDVQIVDKKEWLSVTGACMMTRKDLFLELGGFDEINLPIAYNDMDYCLRAGKLGMKTICVSNIKLYHYESVSRKSDVLARFFNRKRYRKFLAEQEYMRKKWSKEILDDPFYNEKYI